MIAITGATGQLGRLVIQSLLKTVPAAQIVAAVRSPEKARTSRHWAYRCAKPITPSPTHSMPPSRACRNCC